MKQNKRIPPSNGASSRKRNDSRHKRRSKISKSEFIFLLALAPSQSDLCLRLWAQKYFLSVHPADNHIRVHNMETDQVQRLSTLGVEREFREARLRWGKQCPLCDLSSTGRWMLNLELNVIYASGFTAPISPEQVGDFAAMAVCCRHLSIESAIEGVAKVRPEDPLSALHECAKGIDAYFRAGYWGNGSDVNFFLTPIRDKDQVPKDRSIAQYRQFLNGERPGDIELDNPVPEEAIRYIDSLCPKTMRNRRADDLLVHPGIKRGGFPLS